MKFSVVLVTLLATVTTAAKLTQSQAETRLKAAGITATSSGGCTNRNVATCTSYEQVNEETVQGAITLKRACGCEVTVTGAPRRATRAGPTRTGTATSSTSARAPGSTLTSRTPSPRSRTAATATPSGGPPLGTSTAMRATIGMLPFTPTVAKWPVLRLCMRRNELMT
uniref:Uncharacterized protein n=1 Tax=Bionectria ochroleuca TaxID=29856 RepID=A0A8H7KE51_BIOOC